MIKKISSTQHAPLSDFDLGCGQIKMANVCPTLGKSRRDKKTALSSLQHSHFNFDLAALDVAVAVAVDVDLGTSPHGLPADSWPAARMAAVVQPSPSCKTGFDVDVEQENSPELFTFSLTEEQRSCLSFAAMCEAESLEEGDESDELEVQEAIRSLWEARGILEGLQGRSA